MRPYRVTDLRWAWSGDLAVGQDGDLDDTSDSSIASFVQEVGTRLRSSLKDWAIHPNLGASLCDLIGEPNSREIAEEGRYRIRAALVRDGFCNVDLIHVRYAPVSPDVILYNVRVELPGLEEDERLAFSILFDTSEFQVKFL